MPNVTLVRITGSGFVKNAAITPGHPVEYRHWQDVITDCEFALESAVHSEEEEAVVDLWLEDPASFQDADVPKSAGMKRVNSAPGQLQRGDVNHKVAGERWGNEFAEAQSHVASVLKNLGNGR